MSIFTPIISPFFAPIIKLGEDAADYANSVQKDISDYADSVQEGYILPAAFNSHRAAKRYRDSVCKTGVNSDPVFFMDVGAWQGGQDGKPKTTFGLVSGCDALLCSWMSLHEAEKPACQAGEVKMKIVNSRAQSDDCIVASPLINKFLDKASKHTDADGKPSPRGFTLKWIRSDNKPFVPEDKLLVVVPDLHLHGYAGTVDRFRHMPDKDGGLVSLDDELRSLIDIASACSAQTLQVGDQYEVWEMEMLLRMTYLQALSASISTLDTHYSHKEGYSYTTGLPAVPDASYIVDSGLVPIDDCSLSETQRWRGRNRVPFTEAGVKEDGVDFLSTEAIKAAIRKAHPGLYKGKDKAFDIEITGNHDNNLENLYWKHLADSDYRECSLDSKKLLRQPTAKGNNKLRTFHDYSGAKDYEVPDQGLRVWIEHGHYYDWHNNDKHWWLKSHGFDTVTDLLTGWLSGVVGKRSSSGGDNVLAIADSWTDYWDYEMRLPELRRFDEIILNNPEISLVIMGHTHGPDTLGSACRASLGPTQTGYKVFQSGDYYLKKQYDSDWWIEHGTP